MASRLAPDRADLSPLRGPLCVAFTTAPRQGMYLTQAVSSLLQGLHQGGGPQWLAGPLLLVTSQAHAEAAHLAQHFGRAVRLVEVPPAPAAPPGAEQWRETWDYIRTVEACGNLTGKAGYTLVLEDDVISGPDLVERLSGLLRQLETKRSGHWFALRLWATDKFMGWGVHVESVKNLLLLAAFSGAVSSAFVACAVGARSLAALLVGWGALSLNSGIMLECVGMQYVIPPFQPGLSIDFARHGTGAKASMGGEAGMVTGAAMVYPADSRAQGLLEFLRASAGQDQPDNLVREYLAKRDEGAEKEQPQH